MSPHDTARLDAPSLPLIGRARPAMAKATLPDVRKPDVADIWREKIGRSVERTRTLAQMTLKEFADAIGKDERQIARWIEGKDRPQFDAIFSVPTLRSYLVIALAELADDVVVETTISIRRAG